MRKKNALWMVLYMTDEKRREISLLVFGTPDYEGMLEALAPSSFLVRKFNKLINIEERL